MLNRVGSCQPSVSQVPPWGLLHSRCSVTTRWSLDELLAAESWLSLWQAAEHWWTPEPQFTYLYVSVWQCSLVFLKVSEPENQGECLCHFEHWTMLMCAPSLVLLLWCSLNAVAVLALTSSCHWTNASLNFQSWHYDITVEARFIWLTNTS